MNKVDGPIRYDLLQRYRLIEIVALWEGKLNARHLIDYFAIGRQQASKDINDYRRKIAPQNLQYDASAKAYLPTGSFRPRVTSGSVSEYLQLTSRNSELTDMFENFTTGFANVYSLPLPHHHVRPQLVRCIINACRNNERLEVDYRSVNNPDKDGRILCPHALVYSGIRWHVRAYCEKNQQFRDFVLSRFYGVPESMGKSTIDAGDDTAWHSLVSVCFIPDKRLSSEQRKVIAHDYGMTDGKLLLQVRGALVQYLMQMMRVDVNVIAADPRAQQLVVENMDQLKKWLFS